jgi:hypothetical protein
MPEPQKEKSKGKKGGKKFPSEPITLNHIRSAAKQFNLSLATEAAVSVKGALEHIQGELIANLRSLCPPPKFQTVVVKDKATGAVVKKMRVAKPPPRLNHHKALLALRMLAQSAALPAGGNWLTPDTTMHVKEVWSKYDQLQADRAALLAQKEAAKAAAAASSEAVSA